MKFALIFFGGFGIGMISSFSGEMVGIFIMIPVWLYAVYYFNSKKEINLAGHEENHPRYRYSIE